LASGTITALGNISTSGNLSASGSITASSGSITNLNIATSATIGRFNAGSSAVGNLFASGTIITSGNIGVGTAVSAWTSPFSVVQLGATYGAYIAGQNNGADLKVGTNNYYDGANYVYTASNAPASRFDVGQSGAPGFAWNVAASGTVGNTITFTPAMTLDASGNLGIGTNSPGYAATNRKVLAINGGSAVGEGALLAFMLGGTNAGYLYAVASDLELWCESGNVTIGNNANKYVAFRTQNLERMRVTGDGDLLVGTTGASAWSTAGRGLVEVNGSSTALIGLKTGNTQRGYVYSQGTDLIVQAVTGVLSLNGTGGSGAAIDSSGNLGIGTTSPACRLHVDGQEVRLNNSSGPFYSLYTAGTRQWYLEASAGALNYIVTANLPAVFGTNNTERARITSGGELLVGTTTNTNNYKCNFQFSGASINGLIVLNNSSTGAPQLLFLYDSAQTVNNTEASSSYEDTTAQRWALRKNGGLANYQTNNVNLSDQRVKRDVKPLGSMWDKFKAIEIVTFKYKDQTHDDDNIGVIAQQVESVAPEFVDIDGWGKTPKDGVPLKSVYTADMYHAAIKTLQEAMARIEQLEAKVAALEAK
jgi:hypothetical protein